MDFRETELETQVWNTGRGFFQLETARVINGSETLVLGATRPDLIRLGAAQTSVTAMNRGGRQARVRNRITDCNRDGEGKALIMYFTVKDGFRGPGSSERIIRTSESKATKVRRVPLGSDRVSTANPYTVGTVVQTLKRGRGSM